MAKPIAPIDDKELRLAVLKIRALGELASKRQKKNILRKGAKILADAAKENVPISAEPYRLRDGTEISPGFVRDAIRVKSLRKSLDLWVGVVKQNGILPYWAQWLEFGATNRDGSKRPGSAFMRRALVSTGPAVKAQIIKDAQALLAKIVKKVQKGKHARPLATATKTNA
jgi:HK97 gp10 family phage protein